MERERKALPPHGAAVHSINPADLNGPVRANGRGGSAGGGHPSTQRLLPSQRPVPVHIGAAASGAVGSSKPNMPTQAVPKPDTKGNLSLFDFMESEQFLSPTPVTNDAERKEQLKMSLSDWLTDKVFDSTEEDVHTWLRVLKTLTKPLSKDLRFNIHGRSSELLLPPGYTAGAIPKWEDVETYFHKLNEALGPDEETRKRAAERAKKEQEEEEEQKRQTKNTPAAASSASTALAVHPKEKPTASGVARLELGDFAAENAENENVSDEEVDVPPINANDKSAPGTRRIGFKYIWEVGIRNRLWSAINIFYGRDIVALAQQQHAVPLTAESKVTGFYGDVHKFGDIKADELKLYTRITNVTGKPPLVVAKSITASTMHIGGAGITVDDTIHIGGAGITVDGAHLPLDKPEVKLSGQPKFKGLHDWIHKCWEKELAQVFSESLHDMTEKTLKYLTRERFAECVGAELAAIFFNMQTLNPLPRPI